ncbi:hypothetical protein ACHAW6_000110 [Cyclotella cf. meneghiniana]
MIKPTIFYGNRSQAGTSNTTPTTPSTANPTNTLGDEAHKVMSWLMAFGTVDEELSLMSASATRTHALKAPPPQAKSSSAMPKRAKTSTRPSALNNAGTLPHLSIPLMAWPPRMHELPSDMAWLLANKWSRTYSDMANFIRTSMSLAVVRSNTLLLHGNCTNPLCQRAPMDGVAATCAIQLHNQ